MSETITSNNKNVRGKRALLTKIINSDGTFDYYYDREMLNDIIGQFKTNNKEINFKKRRINKRRNFKIKFT